MIYKLFGGEVYVTNTYFPFVIFLKTLRILLILIVQMSCTGNIFCFSGGRLYTFDSSSSPLYRSITNSGCYNERSHYQTSGYEGWKRSYSKSSHNYLSKIESLTNPFSLNPGITKLNVKNEVYERNEIDQKNDAYITVSLKAKEIKNQKIYYMPLYKPKNDLISKINEAKKITLTELIKNEQTH